MIAASDLTTNTEWCAGACRLGQHSDPISLQGFLPRIDRGRAESRSVLFAVNPNALEPLNNLPVGKSWNYFGARHGDAVDPTLATTIKTRFDLVAPALRAALSEDLARLMPAWCSSGIFPNVLEIGAGTGRLSNLVPALKGNSIETDACLEAIHLRLTSETDSRRSFIERADVHALPYPDESFTAVVGLSCLCAVSDPAAAVKEAYRVLKPGGMLWYAQDIEPCLSHMLERCRVPGAHVVPSFWPDSDGTDIVKNGVRIYLDNDLKARLPSPLYAHVTQLASQYGARFPSTDEHVQMYLDSQNYLDESDCPKSVISGPAYVTDLLHECAARAGFTAFDAHWGEGRTLADPRMLRTLQFQIERDNFPYCLTDSMGALNIAQKTLARGEPENTTVVSRPLIAWMIK